MGENSEKVRSHGNRCTHDHHGHSHPPDHEPGTLRGHHDSHPQGHGNLPVSHGHGHHHHAPRDFNSAFAIGTTLNLAFVCVEGAYGIMSGSMALLADAGHNLSDVLGLVLAWMATRFAKRKASERFTYGLKRGTILSAVFNAGFLMLATGAMAWESLGRLSHPEPLQGKTMMVVAGIGILINGATAAMFLRGSKEDLNIRGAFLHMLADALISAGVVAAGAAIHFTGWNRLDAISSLVIGALIVWSSWGLLRDSTRLALDAVPQGTNYKEVEGFFRGLAGVEDVHHLHIWAISTTETALTCHLVVTESASRDAVLTEALAGIQARFGIAHSTLQVELQRFQGCGDCGASA